MANTYSQNFSLTDIFNNKALEKKLPFIKYSEKELENGKISQITNAKTLNKQIFDTSTSVARPFYKPLIAQQKNNAIILSGNLVGDHNLAVESVYNALLDIKQLLSFTANNADIIRHALKESKKNKKSLGIDTKLYLRVQSIQQIQGMNKKQLLAFMNNIMENILFSDNFPITQKKYKVSEMNFGNRYNYSQLKKMWQDRVGE